MDTEEQNVEADEAVEEAAAEAATETTVAVSNTPLTAENLQVLVAEAVAKAVAEQLAKPSLPAASEASTNEQVETPKPGGSKPPALPNKSDHAAKGALTQWEREQVELDAFKRWKLSIQDAHMRSI